MMLNNGLHESLSHYDNVLNNSDRDLRVKGINIDENVIVGAVSSAEGAAGGMSATPATVAALGCIEVGA